MWYAKSKRRWMEGIRWGFKSTLLRAGRESTDTELPQYQLLPSSPSIIRTAFPFNGFAQKLQLKTSVQICAKEKNRTTDPQSSFRKIHDLYSDFTLPVTQSITVLRQSACCNQVVGTALRGDDGAGFSQLEYTTHLVFLHMDVKRVITKFHKDLKSGIMNPTAPKMHIRSETSDEDP